MRGGWLWGPKWGRGRKAHRQELVYKNKVLADNDAELHEEGVDPRYAVAMTINPFQQQLDLKGAQTSDVDICISLSWTTRDDLDLHVVPPGGKEINWRNRAAEGGELAEAAQQAAVPCDWGDVGVAPAESRW